VRKNKVWLHRDEFLRAALRHVAGCRPASVDPDVAAVGPAKRLESLAERAQVRLIYRKALDDAHQYANPRYPIWLLRPRCERPRCRAAEKRYDLAPVHSITSSAMASKVAGTVRRSIRADPSEKIWRPPQPSGCHTDVIGEI
jgi:hypothetical protein